MYTKKMKGKPYGVKLTAAEQKAMDAEINRQLADHLEKHKTELISAVLWDQHIRLGFGPVRLKRTYKSLYYAIDDVIAGYRLSGDKSTTSCTESLKEYGVDLKQWETEICIWGE